MNPTIPIYLDIFVISVTIIIFWFIIYSLNYAYNSYGLIKSKKNLYLAILSAIIIGWLAITTAIALRGTLLNFQSTPPKIMGVIVPPILAIMYLSSSVRVNNILIILPPSWLIYIQSFRILIEIFLWLVYKNGSIPVQMTFSGLNYDILIGLSAPLIAYYSFSEKKWPKIIPLLWNFAGLLLLTNIFIVAFLSAPTPFQQFFNEPANTLPAYFPYVWLPAFIVPFAFLVHILSIKQIMRYVEY